jgi:hypothetical protein
MPADTVALRGRLADRMKDKADAEHARVQIAYHGAGLTFGELAIGDRFHWPPPIPRGPEPMVKSGDDRYEWSRGYGTAKSFYRVERWIEP